MTSSAGPATGAAASRPRLSLPRAENGLGSVLVGVLVVLVGLPLLFVLAQGVFPGIGLTPDWSFQPGLLTEIGERPLWQASLVNSLTLAFGAMVLGGGFGSALAILRHSVAYPGVGILDGAAWVLLVSPSFILAQGWVLFASPSGVAANSFGADWIGPLVFSPGGLIVIMSLTQYPLAYLATSAALRWDDSSYRQAAALSGAGPLTVLRTVRLPLLAPALISGAILVFVDVLGDFGLPAALSTSYSYPTLPYSIYASVRQSPVRFELGGVLSFYLIVILALAIIVYMRILRRSRFDFLTNRASRVIVPRARRPRAWTAVTVLVVLLVLGIPLGSSLQVSLSRSAAGGLAPGNFTLEHYGEIFARGSAMLTGATNSLAIAATVAILTTVLGFLIAVVLTFTGFRGKVFIDLSGTVALAVPGIVLAVGYIFLWNQPVLADLGLSLYGSPVLLVFAGVATALPVAVRLQLGALAQVPPAFLHAAALSGAGLFVRLRTVLLPVVAAAVVSALAAVFASSVFDLAATTMLAPPSFTTLPVEILMEFDRGHYGYATAGALFTAVLVVLCALVASRLGMVLLAPGAPTGPTRGSAAAPTDHASPSSRTTRGPLP
ncbi:iron ABC transporter permease [Ruania alkalisoli]|uniref:Iron ABC transporter permease n=1 Tax=Ruania alkalisoli TaxID=2779775 RepID=A0A7M1SXU1_9MICO|nr:iron ABC transporter permease [Ruania alkalisoli]QOR72390.1 iron ABC transporter permease [Ruania alkalisoli]